MVLQFCIMYRKVTKIFQWTTHFATRVAFMVRTISILKAETGILQNNRDVSNNKKCVCR